MTKRRSTKPIVRRKKSDEDEVVVLVSDSRAARFLSKHLDSDKERLVYDETAEAPTKSAVDSSKQKPSAAKPSQADFSPAALPHGVMQNMKQKHAAELSALNDQLQKEISERRRVEADLQFRHEIDQIVTSIAEQLVRLPSTQVDQGIHKALKTIGEFAQADRSYIFLFSEDGLRMDNTHEWCSPHLAHGQAVLQAVPTVVFPWWMERLRQDDSIVISRLTDLPPAAHVERKFFEARHCQSLLMVPITVNGRVIGLLGLDAVQAVQSWSPHIVVMLKVLGTIFIKALEHKHTQEAMQDNRQQLRQITDTMMDVVWYTDAHGIIEYISPSCLPVLGYSPKQLLGQPFFGNVHPEDTERVKRDIKQVGMVEYRYRSPNGNYLWLETLSNIIIGEKGNFVGVAFASRDITDRKVMERELVEVSRQKNEFLSTAAQKLRSPLTAIRGFSEILLSRDYDPERRERYLKHIHEESVQLSALIDDLFDISQLEAKRHLSIALEPVELASLIRRISVRVREIYPQYRFNFTGLAACPLVMGDPIRLGQLIHNLLTHAVQVSPDGSEITVHVQQLIGEIIVGVKDCGEGMTAEEKTHLFDKFYLRSSQKHEMNPDTGTKRETSGAGTGLGMAISKLIIELHRGKIWADSDKQQGTTLYFTLPIAASNALNKA
ncbi:MAG: PAS domain S-box protein [Anaerolineae bacterium]|nr:PAS domain S-box protein [Anaerolineae bacterium]